jgi:DNA uptake protein ComE-like DNA-binding protein
MTDPAGQGAAVWTPAQRGVLVVSVLVLVAFLAIRLWVNRQSISDPPPARAARADELLDRLDPNVAGEKELAALPQLGEKRAHEIVAYREQFRADGRGPTPFKSPDDLLKIRGVGVSMVETLKPYVMFPTTQTTTDRAYNPGP